MKIILKHISAVSLGDAKGMTLAELLVTVAVLGVLVAITATGINALLPKYRLKQAARDLVSNMQTARMNAVKQRKDWAIYFEGDSSSKYYVCSDKGADDDWTTTTDNTIYKTVDLSDYRGGVGYGHGSASSPKGSVFDDHVTYNINILTFNPRGTCNQGYVYLEDEEDNTYVIGSTSTGQLVFEKWNGSNWSD